jgi:hypothetical protein
MSRDLVWYARRLQRMSATEVAGRVRDRARQAAWAHRQVRPGDRVIDTSGAEAARLGQVPVPPGIMEGIPAEARSAVITSADRLVAGEWTVLGVARPDIAEPDWFLDPVTGRRAPQHALAFRIDHRDESVTGNVKSVWELSRHHHLTVLAAAYWLTGDETYAEVVDRQLRSWWSANPFLSGIHWTSGIEVGVRLISWAWVRRLLDGWPKVGDLFETNDDALRQIRWHQEYLAAFRSHGSSANNHAIAEEAGRLIGACAFPWYAESERWRHDAAARLSGHVLANTYPDGVNRELATDYHRFVTELVTLAAVEGAVGGAELPSAVWARLAASYDAAAGLLDVTGAPPRQGDGDEGRALVVDDALLAPWAGLLDWGAGVVGARDWWPEQRPTVIGAMLAGLLGRPRSTPGRPSEKPRRFPDAGITILTSDPQSGPEVWCRCDGGPLGFLAIAAHGHADALSVEVRHAGTEILVDPGTYCYHGEPQWRSYFRSTRAHNTLELDGTSQALESGPFMWSGEVPAVEAPVADATRTWHGRHLGYARLAGSPVVERKVRLAEDGSLLVLEDLVTPATGHDVRLSFHVGPAVHVTLDGTRAELEWVGGDDTTCRARMDLPPALHWSAHRAETDPPLGWYSPRFGERVPTTTLVGQGWSPTEALVTTLAFVPVRRVH